MTTAILYRWKLKPSREDEFRAAWLEGTKLIHTRCASYGARLHEGRDGLFWSYARWPSEASRQTCFADHAFFDKDCFKAMQTCIEERFDEVVLSITDDALDERATGEPVPVYETDRLVLRPMVLDDAESLHVALSDAANMRYWSRGPLESVAATRDYICWNIDGAGVQCFAVAMKDAPETALGWVILMDSKDGVAELGYIMRPDCQGRGLAREAVVRVLEHGFKVRGLRRIWADTDPDNTGSIRLLEALGFEREGQLKGEWETHIGIRDSVIFGLTCP